MSRRNKKSYPKEGIRGKKYDAAGPRRASAAYDSHGVWPEQLSLDALVKNYLCLGEYSDCVHMRYCECLDACKFGQRYLELIDGEDFPNPISKKTG